MSFQNSLDSVSKRVSNYSGYILSCLHKLFKQLTLASIATILISAFISFFLLKTCLNIDPVYTSINHAVDKPFVIYLNESVRSISTSDISISPSVEGAWSFKSGILINNDQLIFTPKDYFKVDTSYEVKISNIQRVLLGPTTISNINFRTAPAPGLADVGLTTAENESTVAADYTFVAKLTEPNRGLRSLELKTTPTLKMIQIASDDQQYTWKPETLLPQGSTVNAQLYDSKNDIILAEKTLNIASEPVVTVPVKQNLFNESDVATIEFNQAIDPSYDNNISFDIDGKGRWRSESIYEFTPTKITPGQRYSYKILAGLRTQSGGILTKDYNGTFNTVGHVQVTGKTPYGSNVPLSNNQISFSFDQPVDHTSVEERFSVSPGRITGFSWQGNKFIVGIADLNYQTTVTATISAGVKNVGFGLPSNQSFSNTFVTEARSVKLDVPFYYQQYAATCAAASLRMALAYYGIKTDDMSIVYRMGYNPTVKNKSTNPATWDDPQEMFVGSVNGTIEDGTAAGPDAQPVAKAAISFGVGASAVTGTNINWIAEQIYNNHPVVLFGASFNTPFVSWETPSGRIETMNITSHARLVTGVVGEIDNPIGFWISDPITGKSYWTAKSVTATMKLDAYQQAVVIY